MKKTLTLIFLISTTSILSANKNWIEIEPANKTQTKKTNAKTDINLSQVEPINKMLKNASVVKQLLDVSSKKERPTNEKNWFLLNNETSK